MTIKLSYPIAQSSRPGLTLLELLVSLAILSMLVVAGSSWLVTTSRASIAQARYADDTLPLRQALEALHADIDEAQAGSVEVSSEANQSFRISATTCHSAGGESPGWKRVEWNWSARTGDLNRTTTDPATSPERRLTRTALRGVAGAEFRKIADVPAIPLSPAPTKGAPAKAAQAIRVPLGELVIRLAASDTRWSSAASSTTALQASIFLEVRP